MVLSVRHDACHRGRNRISTCRSTRTTSTLCRPLTRSRTPSTSTRTSTQSTDHDRKLVATPSVCVSRILNTHDSQGSVISDPARYGTVRCGALQHRTAWYGSAVATFTLEFSIFIALHCGDAWSCTAPRGARRDARCRGGSGMKELSFFCVLFFV